MLNVKILTVDLFYKSVSFEIALFISVLNYEVKLREFLHSFNIVRYVDYASF